ncbi:hypothetical protein KP509_06G062100 [Ceratopteris richardii]|uniref:Uncharacterized protein n=1 Tax=Ceratopteris richardii TaxID=49495 RepID=A0A8T2UIV1_CERRI|nr:hypothetical protein KP509_06G062100 [Ceratopteris richardii]
MEGPLSVVTKPRVLNLASRKYTISLTEVKRGIDTVRSCGIRSSDGRAFTQRLPVPARAQVSYVPSAPCKWRSSCFRELGLDISELSATSTMKPTEEEEEEKNTMSLLAVSHGSFAENITCSPSEDMSEVADEEAQSILYSVVTKILELMAREIYLSYKFVSYDLTATVLPGALISIVSHIKLNCVLGSNIKSAPLWRSLFCSTTWTWLFIYVFTPANQTQSARNGGEDSTNKPSRPIPLKLVTINRAFWRLGFVCTTFVLYGMYLGSGLLSTAWVACALILNFIDASLNSLHWLIEPIVMMVGIVVINMVNISIVAPSFINYPTLIFMAAIAKALGLFGSSIQDHRDVEGDRLSGGRVTLPILLGNMPSRLVTNILLLCCWATLHASLAYLNRPFNAATSFVILVWCLLLCFRTWTLQSPSEDHKTYSLFVYLYSFVNIAYYWAV